jgi:hypothetical protein
MGDIKTRKAESNGHGQIMGHTVAFAKSELRRIHASDGEPTFAIARGMQAACEADDDDDDVGELMSLPSQPTKRVRAFTALSGPFYM